MNEQAIETYDSRDAATPVIEEFRELLKYRHLVKQLTLRGIKARYKRSFLGVFWTMLNPLGMTIVMTIVYSRVFKSETPNYSLYVLSGLVCWTFFTQTSLNSISELVWGGSLLTRIYVPPAVFIATALGTGLVNFTISIIPIAFLVIITGAPITPALLFVPISIVCIAMFAIGIGLLLSTLAVYFIDIQDMYQIFILMWMMLTPINYPREVLADQFNYLLVANPMAYMIDLFRLPIYQGVLPSSSTIFYSFLCSTSALLIGWFFFTRKVSEYAYRI
jgi:ABC-type polysaccharide/polyol phosphate export permease